MIDQANTICQMIAQEVVDSKVEIMYDDYIDEYMAGYEILQYSVQSYNNDAAFYGEQK